jgi:hypothetical protein
MQTFPAHEIGNELLTVYEKTGLAPFDGINTQSEMTPTQKWVVGKTLEHRQEKKEEKYEEAQNGNGPGGPGGGMTPNSAHSKRQELMESNVGGGQSGTMTYVNEDFDEDKGLFMDDEEVMTEPDVPE